MDYKKRKTDEQFLIRQITGKGKFFQLNLDLLLKLGLVEATLLTYVLDRIDFFIELKKINFAYEGVIIYRKELEDVFGLSPHIQRQTEKSLKEKKILDVTTKFDGKERYNIYTVQLENVFEIKDEGT